jgi:peptide chain release factor 1
VSSGAPDAVLARLRERGDAAREELSGVEQALADPAVHADPTRARALGRSFSRLSPVVAAYREYESVTADLEALGEMLTEADAEDRAELASEAEELRGREAELVDRLQTLFAPRDPNDERDVLLEVKAGEGGAESALFAGDLMRMYERYCERRGWKVEVLDVVHSDLGGVTSATLAVRGKPGQSMDDLPYARLKFEGGVHRVQRVPVTESQGRIHTSAAGVLVLPEADEVEVEIAEADLRVDVYRSSGPGGQSVNTTDSAVRITHVPTGIVVSCQNEKSQLQNKEQAMRILRARLLDLAQSQADEAATQARRSQVRTVDRSERVRTYNFPENRIADHRVGYKAYNLAAVMDGDLDDVVSACMAADMAARLVEQA